MTISFVLKEKKKNLYQAKYHNTEHIKDRPLTSIIISLVVNII